MKEIQKKKISKTWKNANNSVMITIPKSLVDKYDLNSSEFVIIEDTSHGIFIKKLELK